MSSVHTPRVAPEKPDFSTRPGAVFFVERNGDCIVEFFLQYQHPEWQKKRLQVLERAGWKCEQCGDADKQMHVHHKRYIKGRKVWEYNLENFEALCGACHEDNHEAKDRINDILAWLPGYMWTEAADVLFGWAGAIPQSDQEDYSAYFYAGKLAGICQDLSRKDIDTLIEQAQALRSKPCPPSGLID